VCWADVMFIFYVLVVVVVAVVPVPVSIAFVTVFGCISIVVVVVISFSCVGITFDFIILGAQPIDDIERESGDEYIVWVSSQQTRYTLQLHNWNEYKHQHKNVITKIAHVHRQQKNCTKRH